MSSTALEMHVAVAILRVQEGLDYSGVIADFELGDDSENGDYEKKVEGLENPVFIEESRTAPFSNDTNQNTCLSVCLTSAFVKILAKVWRRS